MKVQNTSYLLVEKHLQSFLVQSTKVQLTKLPKVQKKGTNPLKMFRKPCDSDGKNAWTAMHIPGKKQLVMHQTKA